MTQITPKQARTALYNLAEARDNALLFGVHSSPWAGEDLFKTFEKAAQELGFALVPLTQDKPDSGRASIPETEPEVGEQV